ncbi:copper homeostasis protein CutC [Cutibacterium equinum]|uniref:Copper homeostasis protein cutC homolog n=1 Tax=Cutibacterium equinum TaxID=3016342 RepID=A0ABY7QZ78_9ACTN|nr:copper homeostasis protein CutC [Cutibacterium equinum]WCC80349.1 copper homeostasis protein CutC [Cutibacterium equinum]
MALLEVICLHENDAKRAAQGGADRIELVGTMDDDGLAPSPELLARTLSVVDIPVRPMMRLDSGFRAGPRRRDEMVHLLSTYRDLGADGPVLGFLDEATGVDIETVTELTEGWSGWTFHRAIDNSLEPDKAWVQLLTLPRLDQVLTAGSPRGIEHGLDDLISRAEANPRVAELIMAGGGLRPEHVPWLYRAGVRAFHIGSPARPQGSWKAWVDADLVRSWRDLLDRLAG